jgi:hypothetical protein
MSEPRCPACGGELEQGIVISSTTVWTDSRMRFVPARFLNDRSLFGRYRKEMATAARACLQCGAVTLFVNPGTLAAMLQQ